MVVTVAAIVVSLVIQRKLNRSEVQTTGVRMCGRERKEVTGVST